MAKSKRTLPILTAQDVQRFWSKVQRLTPDRCWEWTAAIMAEGYGAFRIAKETCYAHRIAYSLSCGPIPKELCVLHQCDNRRCCNPAHLFIGTDKDNAIDKSRKGRCHKSSSHRGETHHQAKLRESDIHTIRQRAANGESKIKIAYDYGVDRTLIYMIEKRRIWTHV